MTESSNADLVLAEGWYLMTVDELERELARHRDTGSGHPPTGAPRLSVTEALARRNAGNMLDAHGRTLRLVLHNQRPGVPGLLEQRRLAFEPDYHDPPRWRRPGSVPVNVVPLVMAGRAAREPEAWFERPELQALEGEWESTGGVEGLQVPADLRGFVFKTVLSLRAAGKAVSPESVSDSIARWLPAQEATKVRSALLRANAR